MRFVTRAIRLGGGLAAVIALGIPAIGWAQAAKGPKPAGARMETEIEEITVTAQKREENIQEVPISVTALTAETLATKGVGTVLDLNQSVPGVQALPASQGASNFAFSVRGIQQSNNNMAQNPKMGLYVDGVYIAKQQGNNMDLEDLERVEVLRGPQGTLFGRNTILGAVQLVTRKPTEERSIIANTEVGNYNAFKGRLTVNMPLIGKNGFWQSDALGTISLRENVVYKHNDGYVDNVSPTDVKASGAAGLSSLNRVSTWTAVRWQPTKAVTIDYAFEYNRFRETPTAFQLMRILPYSLSDAKYRIPNTNTIINNPFLPAGGLTPYVRPNREDAIGNNATPNTPDLSGPTHRLNEDGNNRMHFLTLAWDLGEHGPFGNLTVKSINHYRNQFMSHSSDLDGSPLAGFSGINHTNLSTWSTEEQLLGTLPRIHYVLGAIYYGEQTTADADAVVMGGKLTNSHQFNTNWADSYAAFGQATWTLPILSDKLSLTGGIRYNQDHTHSDKLFQCLGGAGCASAPAFKKGVFGDFGGADAITFTGDASYQWTDSVMTYFRVSQGWQSGFANQDATDQRLFNVVDPEKMLTYEGGLKSQVFENRVRVNADMYYSTYTDQVINTFQAGPTGPQALLQNAGKSRIWGAEVEATAIPLRGVEVDATYTYCNAKFTEFLEQAFDAQGRPIEDSNGTLVKTDVSDFRPLTLNPKHKFSVGATYTAPPTSAGVFSARVDTFWQNDQIIFTVPLPGNAGVRNVDGWAYAVVNGRLLFSEIPLQKGSLDLYAFGKNLFDRKYRTWAIDFGDSLGFTSAAYGTPRTFGLGLTYNFSEGAAPPPPVPVAQAAPPPPAPPAKKKIVLRSVHFDFDKATLKAEAKPILDEAIQVLKQEGSVDIVVEGHTDSVGTDQYNLSLSRRRAETVRTYLVDHGIAKSRITAEGLGEAKPVASNDTADGRAQNRRVELRVK
ncbi:MAG: OmpA family protein [Candidatus Binatia bacterium]